MPPEHHLWQLHHTTLCPFSRTIRLVLSKRGLAYGLVVAVPADLIAALKLGRDSRIPALRDRARGIRLVGSYSICEYLEETASGPSMLLGSGEQRAEVRRLVAWADDCLYVPVTLPLQIAAFDAGPQPVRPSSVMIGVAADFADMFIDEIGYLLDYRAWLAGPALSLADLAIAAHLSVLDYFGAVDWTGHGQAQTWYSVLKSRRSFQPLLADRIEGIEPPGHYSKIDS